MENILNQDFQSFEKRLDATLKRLRNIPVGTKFDEASLPLYLHKNFLVRKIFIDRFKAAYKMTSFKNKGILDYGCGSGIFLEAISQEIKQGIGIDVDIDIAKKIITSKNIVLNQINHENEIIKFSNIDIITSFDVLEHIIDLDPLLKIFAEVISPKGTLIVSGPTENFLHKLARKIARIGIIGNQLGSIEHVRNIYDVKNNILDSGFLLQGETNLWDLFVVLSFKIKN